MDLRISSRWMRLSSRGRINTIGATREEEGSGFSGPLKGSQTRYLNLIILKRKLKIIMNKKIIIIIKVIIK